MFLNLFLTSLILEYISVSALLSWFQNLFILKKLFLWCFWISFNINIMGLWQDVPWMIAVVTLVFLFSPLWSIINFQHIYQYWRCHMVDTTSRMTAWLGGKSKCCSGWWRIQLQDVVVLIFHIPSNSCVIIQQGRQCMYNVTLRCVCKTIVAVEKQYCIFVCVCACTLVCGCPDAWACACYASM